MPTTTPNHKLHLGNKFRALAGPAEPAKYDFDDLSQIIIS